MSKRRQPTPFDEANLSPKMFKCHAAESKEDVGCSSCQNKNAVACLLRCPQCHQLVCNGMDDDGTEDLEFRVPTTCHMHICEFCEELIGCGKCVSASLCEFCREKHCYQSECILKGCIPKRPTRIRKEATCENCHASDMHLLLECKTCKRWFCHGQDDDSIPKIIYNQNCFILFCLQCDVQLGCRTCAPVCTRCELTLHCSVPFCKKMICNILQV